MAPLMATSAHMLRPPPPSPISICLIAPLQCAADDITGPSGPSGPVDPAPRYKAFMTDLAVEQRPIGDGSPGALPHHYLKDASGESAGGGAGSASTAIRAVSKEVCVFCAGSVACEGVRGVWRVCGVCVACEGVRGVRGVLGVWDVCTECGVCVCGCAYGDLWHLCVA